MDRSLLRRKLPFLYGLFLYLTRNKNDEKLLGERKSFGEKNPGKTFLIIKINNPILGLMAIYNTVLGYLYLAQKKGLIPVVDLKNFDNGYLYKEEIGKINAWDYYFEQPSDYTLEEVYESKNVIMASGMDPKEASPIVLKHYYLQQNTSNARLYYNIISRQIRIKDPIQEKIEQDYQKLLGGKRVIGVVKRGSDIINASGHSIQPALSDVIAKTKEMLVKWNCDSVFLASEEAETVDVFRTEFGSKLVVNDSKRIKNYSDKRLYIDISFDRENDKFLKGLEYLTTVVLLSKCNCLIGSLVGATVGALGMNMGQYEHVYIYDLGEYK